MTASGPCPGEGRFILLSLKPRFAKAILSGRKTVELRRVGLKAEPPLQALLYASSPERSLLGVCNVVAVRSGNPETLWDEHREDTGLKHDEFFAYFKGASKGTALTLTDLHQFDPPVSLEEIRAALSGFRPPQSFAYLSASVGGALVRMAQNGAARR